MVNLTYKQTKALDLLEDSDVREILYGGSAGGGKSFLGCYWQLKTRLKYPNTKGLIGRSKLKTLKETTLQTFFEVCNTQGVKSGTHFVYNAQSSIIDFYNGSQLILKDLFYYPSDPQFDELGSLEITDGFIDEVNQVTIKAVNIVKSRMRYKHIESGLKPKLFMSCNPAKNWVYNEFYKPSRDNTLQSNKAFIQALAIDNPNLPPHYIETLRALPEIDRERLLMGNWDYDKSPDMLILPEMIQDIFFNEHIEKGRTAITADVARYGSDKAVIVVWEGFRAIDFTVLDISSITEIVNIIKAKQGIYGVTASRVVIDDDGVGGGVTDYVNGIAFKGGEAAKNTGDGKENYNNFKTQCYFRLAERINRGGIFVNLEGDNKDKLIQELNQVRRKNMDADGKLQIKSKDEVKKDIGRSPDFADALMMREALEIESSTPKIRHVRR
jgi:phage terminase large subunit